MFYISKFFWMLTRPGMLLMLLLVMGLILLFRTRFVRTGRALLVAAAGIVVIAGFLPLSTWLILPLEERFPRADLSAKPVDGIVVLGGAEDSRVATGRGVQAFNEAGERFTEAVALARRYPDAKIIFTGGAIEILMRPTIGADAAGRIFSDLGIGSDRLRLERAARNTYENAALTRDIANPQPEERWLLVTSAWHMPRSIGIFRQAGFPVEAWPVDYRTTGVDDAFVPFFNPLEGLRRFDFVAKEWVALTVNWLSGRSDALLPAP